MGLTEQINGLSQSITSFFTVPFQRIAHFNNLAMEEKIGYGVVMGGLILLLTSLVLFII